MLAADVVECVVGLGPNLFYNSPMESCLLICRPRKPAERQGRILFINAVKEVKTEKTINKLEEHHIQRIVGAYHRFTNEEGFAQVATVEEVLANKANLSISLYVEKTRREAAVAGGLHAAVQQWDAAATGLRASLQELLTELA